jgi:serine/threonine protein kinase
MALTSGTKVGPYEIAAPIGAGGMREVYRARDSRLGREVAIKILPESFARDTDRLQRFEHEARAVAALNHPNILAIYDIGSHEGLPYIVSELLEGQQNTPAAPQRKAAITESAQPGNPA